MSTRARRYDLLAIDLDGTLLDHSGRVSAENLAALAAARREGMIVTVCTGRALHEAMPIIRMIGQTGPVVVSGGAMVSDPQTQRTLERFAIDEELVHEVVAYLAAEEHAAVILKDPHPTSYDYLVVGAEGEAGVDLASRWWFRKTGARVRYAEAAGDDEHPEHSVRIGAYQANEPIDALAERMRERFKGSASMQHFHGALLPQDRIDEGIQSVHIVELFHVQVDKWQAIDRLCRQMGIDPARTAAIGDQLNDVEMITHAGLGVAMGNAHERITAAADRQTLRCEESGVAHAVEKILSGEW